MSLRSLFSQASEDAQQHLHKLNNLTLIQQWKKSYRNHEYEPSALLTGKIMAACLYIFLSTTSVYCSLNYWLPYYLSEVSDWTLYYCKVFNVFVFIQTTANWMCSIFYSTDYKRTQDRPDLTKSLWDEEPIEIVNGDRTTVTNGNARYSSEKKEMPWYYCVVCQFHCPPRCHHCRACGTCILKRDHHCFMLGTCIGYYNQRYFVMLSFYLIFAGFLGIFLVYQYLSAHFFPTSDWIDLFLPYVMYRFVTFDLELRFMLMIWHLYFLWVGGLLGLGFFMSQMYIIFLGKTSHEAFTPQLKIKVTSSVGEHFRSVFGNFWGLNFIFPAVILFRQPGDGTEWNNVHLIQTYTLEKQNI